MKAFLLSLLSFFLMINYCHADKVISYNFCKNSNGIEIKQSLNISFLELLPTTVTVTTQVPGSNLGNNVLPLNVGCTVNDPVFTGVGDNVSCQIVYSPVCTWGVNVPWPQLLTFPMTQSGGYVVGTGYTFNALFDPMPALVPGRYEYKCRCTIDGGLTWQWSDPQNFVGNIQFGVTPLPSPAVTIDINENSGNVPDDGNLCSGDDVSLTANAIDLTPPLSYLWTTSSINQMINVVNLTGTTSYTVTVTDALNCSAVQTVNIMVSNLPVANDTELNFCGDATHPGEFFLAEAELTPGFPNTNSNSGDDVDDGAANMTVTYHATLADAQNGSGALSSPYIAPDGTTIFARVESNITGCFSTADILLTVHISPVNVEIQNINNGNSSADFDICEQDQINITADEGTGGTAPYTYDWVAPDGATFSTQTINIASANPTIHHGIWNVTVTDVNGCTGTDNITISITSNPSNDDCSNSIVVNAGANTNLTNECAFQDIITCGNQSESSVWFEYTVGPAEDLLNLVTTGINNSVIQVYDGCGGNLLLDADGNDCDGTVDLECIPQGTVLQIYVSSASIDASDNFTLTVSPTFNGVANDECNNGEVIPDNPICEFFSVVPTNTTNACPEQFTVAGCALDYSNAEIIWYEFTTPPGTGSIEIENLRSDAYITIFEDCPATTVLSGGDCISLGTTTPIPVNDNTTYYIAVGINGTPGFISYDIKYNQAIPNDDACGPGFIPTPLAGVLPNQDNSCATDDNDCGASPIENTLWYSFDLSAPNNVITININGIIAPSIAIYDAANPCNATPIDEECEGDGEKSFTCLQPGTYTIMVGTSDANSGIFTITGAESQNSAVANDICSNAIPITIGPNDLCVVLGPFSATNEGACPENISGAADPCDFNTGETSWYSFVAPGVVGDVPTMDFEFTSYSGTGTPFMGVFSGSDCSNLNTIEACNSGFSNFSNLGPFTPGQSYLIGIASADDDGGDFEFEVKFNLGPLNDDPCSDLSLFDITGSGSTSGTTSCAGGDILVSGCPAADQDNDVFYQFTVPDGVSGITVEVEPNGPDGYSGNVVLSVIEANCNGGVEFESACGSGVLTHNFNCLAPGDYFLLVSTANTTSGDFNLDYSAIPFTGPANDLCANAEVLPLTACEWEPVSGTTIQACYENFNAGGCSFSDDPTVFYEFTTPPGATKLSLRNVSPNSYVAIITACQNGSFLACSEDGPIDFIAITENTTYYLAVGSNDVLGLDFDFEIQITVPPANDCTPEIIPSGGNSTLESTCCAFNLNDPGSCPPNNQENTVWYEYRPDPASKAVTVTFSPGTINGSIVVEGFTGAPGQDCFGSFTSAADPFCITAGTYEFLVKCEDWSNTSVYIKVGSTGDGCGTFRLDFLEGSGCEGAETCPDIVTKLSPITGRPAVCATSCNNFNCSEPGDCDPNGSSVWFQIHPELTASAMIIQIDAPFDPIVSLFQGPDCANLTQILACEEDDVIIPPVLNSATDVFVLVEAANGEDLGEFEICVATLLATFDCYTSNTQVTRPEYPSADPEGPYCPGETVKFCHFIEFTVAGAAPPDGNSCQWIQGIVPTFGNGWDVLNSNLTLQGPPAATWLPENSVDYNFPNAQYEVYTTADGLLGLNYDIGGGNVTTGTLLPGGWWFTSNGGAGCLNNGDPDTMWGLTAPDCDEVQRINFCFEMKVKDWPDLPDCETADLEWTIFAFADGETGCWTNVSCALSVPYRFEGDIDCNGEIELDGQNQFEICTGEDVDIEITANVIGSQILVNTVDNPNVTGESFTTSQGVFNNSIAQFTDNLVNTGTTTEIVQYTFVALGSNSICKGPEYIVEVTVYPELLVEFPPTYVCEDLCTTLTPVIFGGTGTYVEYDWSTGANTPSITVCPKTDTEYEVTVTDNHGCTGIGTILVEWKEKVTGDIDPDPLYVCQDGIDNFGEFYTIVDVLSGQDPYSITWDSPFGLFGQPATTNHPDDTYVIEEEASTALGTPVSLCVNIVDVWGCEVDICSEVLIDGAADVLFTHAPLICGQNSTVLTANFDFGNSNAGLDEFKLFDCEGNLIDTENNDPSFFPIADLTANNCFELHTITNSGCLTIKTLTVLPPTGIEPIVTAVSPICEGQNSLLNVTNSAAYSNIEWSTTASGPSTNVSPTTTTNYSVTVTESNGCTATKVVTVVVNPLPEISILGSLSFCTGFSTTIEASAGPGINYQWRDASLTVVSDTSVLTVNTGGTYTVNVSSGGSCAVDSTITILESTSLQVSMSNIDLCDNAVDTLTPGNFFVSYVWTKDNQPLSETSSKLPVTDAGNYCVSVSDGNCSGIGCVDVINNNSPIANVLIPFSEVCRINSGVGPTSIDFTTLVSGANGTWIDSDFTGVDLSDLTNVSFIDIPRDTYTFTFITNTAIAPCENDTVAVDIFVRNCFCPTISFQPIVLCNDETNAVNLNQYLIVPEVIRPGIWTVTGGPASIPVSNDSLININNVAGGIYQLAWQTTTVLGPACQTDSTHVMTINDAPDAGVKGNKFVCNTTNPLGPTNIDLDSVLIAGTSAGAWIQTSGTTVTLDGNNIFDATGMSPGVLQFTYNTTAATPPCDETFVLLTVDIRDCNCPIITISNDTLCNGSDVVDLNTLLTIQPAMLPGTWTTNAPGSPITGSNFNATGITSGAYSITYTLNTSPGLGCDVDESASLVIRRQPSVTVLSEGSPCNANTGNGTTNVNLNALISGTQGGVWTQISGSTPLTIPLSGIVDFIGLTIGEVYEFRYDLPTTAPCTPASATVRVVIKDCECPNVDLITPSPVCNSDVNFDLSTLEGPDVAAGTWTVTDPSGNAVSVLLNELILLDGAKPGIYVLTYTLNPAPSGNCPKSNQVPLSVVEEKSAMITPSTTVCNVNAGNDENIIDFRDFLIGTSFGGGTWANTDNAPVNFSDVTNVNFSNTTVGDKFTFTYSINNQDPCQDHQYTIEIEVIDCSCPPIRPGDPVDVCTANGTLALSPTYDDPNNPGKWESTQITINANGVADLSNLTSGNYIISYVIDNPLQGCPDKEDRTLTVVKVKNAGTSSSLNICNNEPQVVRLSDLLSGEDVGGVWKETSIIPSIGNAFNANLGTFNTNNQAASSYVFEYGFINQTPCPDVKQTVTVNVISAPTAQAGDPATINCIVAEVTLGDPTDNQPNVTYQWTHDSGLPVPNADKATTKVNFGGEFTIVVTDNVTGCKSTDDVIISVDPNKPIAQFNKKDVTCFQQRDGSIAFINITGGQAPLQYSNNGGTTFQSSPIFNNLNGGVYPMVIKDATGCVFTQTIEIEEPPLLSINLGNDIIITKGESDTLSLIGQLPDNLASIQWTATDSSGVKIICNLPPEQCSEVIYKPETSTTICVTVIDDNGCEAEDCKVINLNKARNIVFSNTLQPGNSGENKYFYVESGSVAWVNSMSVYDRWGNLMFDRNDFIANQPDLGWDGKFNGKEVVPGVYTWVIELEYDSKGSGDLEVFVGDVTVIK